MANEMNWHEVTDEEKEEIKSKAKDLLDEFSNKLKSINGEESHFENESGLREEGKPWNNDPNFQDITLLNAPFVEDYFITAEKARWNK